jgi:hypothetical protein
MRRPPEPSHLESDPPRTVGRSPRAMLDERLESTPILQAGPSSPAAPRHRALPTNPRDRDRPEDSLRLPPLPEPPMREPRPNQSAPRRRSRCPIPAIARRRRAGRASRSPVRSADRGPLCPLLRIRLSWALRIGTHHDQRWFGSALFGRITTACWSALERGSQLSAPTAYHDALQQVNAAGMTVERPERFKLGLVDTSWSDSPARVGVSEAIPAP